jgi:hypothetical protein
MPRAGVREGRVRSLRPESAEYYGCLSTGSCGYRSVLTRGELTVYAKPAWLAEWRREEPARGAAGCS